MPTTQKTLTKRILSKIASFPRWTETQPTIDHETDKYQMRGDAIAFGIILDGVIFQAITATFTPQGQLVLIAQASTNSGYTYYKVFTADPIVPDTTVTFNAGESTVTLPLLQLTEVMVFIMSSL